MEDKEYRKIKRRIMYEDYKEQLPKCDNCSECMKFDTRYKRTMRACAITHRIVEGRTATSPEWCPYRR